MKAKTSRRGLRPRPWHALAVPSAIAMAVAVPGAAAHPSALQPWTVTGTVDMHISDYETFGSNETCNHRIPITNTGTTGTTSNYWYFGKCGGEIRVEIHYRISRDQSGKLSANGDVYFYEGASENTTDLDGTEHFNLPVPPRSSGSTRIHVANYAEGQPADFARVTLALNNP
ncbi:hypothetical protein [Planomonospora venezuelensis]|uniref:Uncharacterized protein n=1 Tax=Planomonospora venezuelensis TaxID=1999 RepID=A0A841CST3_PLAVE|nr:hypothetical protein [Planomonospora venezuelensis]MBB5961482.1 hypothetical protein [Planomonospora venezuelensis]GIM98625.1 hypothetical protein Pve01_02840 [Planomonospora venezuelensis]